MLISSQSLGVPIEEDNYIKIMFNAKLYQAVGFIFPIVFNTLIVRILLSSSFSELRNQFALLISVLPLMTVADAGESNLLILNASRLGNKSERIGSFLVSYFILKLYKLVAFCLVALLIKSLFYNYRFFDAAHNLLFVSYSIACWAAYSVVQDSALLRGLNYYKLSSYVQILASLAPIIGCLAVIISRSLSQDIFAWMVSAYLLILSLLTTSYIWFSLLIGQTEKPQILSLNVISIIDMLYNGLLDKKYLSATINLALSSYLFVQLPKLFLLAISPNVASTFTIFQSLAFKANGFSSAVNEVYLNKSSLTSNSKSQILKSLYSHFLIIKCFLEKSIISMILFIWLASVAFTAVINPMPFNINFCLSLFLLISGSLISATKSRSYYYLIEKGQHARNSYIQWVCTFVLALLLVSAYILGIGKEHSPILACSLFTFISQLIYTRLYCSHGYKT